jgi:hypothetical protein
MPRKQATPFRTAKLLHSSAKSALPHTTNAGSDRATAWQIGTRFQTFKFLVHAVQKACLRAR